MYCVDGDLDVYGVYCLIDEGWDGCVIVIGNECCLIWLLWLLLLLLFETILLLLFVASLFVIILTVFDNCYDGFVYILFILVFVTDIPFCLRPLFDIIELCKFIFDCDNCLLIFIFIFIFLFVFVFNIFLSYYLWLLLFLLTYFLTFGSFKVYSIIILLLLLILIF